MYVSFRKDRYEFQELTLEEVESLGIKAVIHQDSWEISYIVPFSLIEKYIPGYQFEEGMAIRANFYKCGDDCEIPHYIAFAPVTTLPPGFHNPDCFMEFKRSI